MHYDPIKNIFAGFIRTIPFTRVLFYKTLDLMFLRSWYVRRELRHIREQTEQKPLAIYDAGTGYAQYTYYMSKKMNPCTIYAVDVKEEWIEDSREFFENSGVKNVSFGVEDLTTITHYDKFDVIVCVDVMEHIQDDVTVFRNYHKALKKGGYFIMNTPSIYGGSDMHDDDDESFIGEHARQGYSIEDIEAKLIPLGFTIYRYRYTYGTFGDIAWRMGIKAPIQLVNFSKFLLVFLPFYFVVMLLPTLLFMAADYLSTNKVGSGINVVARKL